MDIQGITVIGDWLRPTAQGQPGGTDRPTAWLYNAIRRQLGLATALPVSLLTPTALPELAAWITAQRTAAEADAWWAAQYRAIPTPPAWLVARLQRQFCVTYEAPPYLITLLDLLGLPWLDIRLHPVRFLDDLLFAVRAASADTQAAAFTWAVPESRAVASAGLLEAIGQLISDAAVPANTLLVAGQRPMDASQIVGDAFFDAFDHKPQIDALCAAHAAVVLKPHPAGDAHSLLVVAANAPAHVLGVIADNTYRMLALPEVASVLTVNSSLAYEAGYFGKRVHTLAPLPITLAWAGDAPDMGRHVSLDAAILAPDFWRMIIAPHTRVTETDGMRLPPKPNRLRIAMDSFWNFQEVDTDRIPRAA